MSGWQKYTFEDVCRKIYSGGTPSTKHAEYWNGTINWLSSGETGNRFIYDTERKITELGVKKSATKKAYKGNTVVASAGQGYTRGQASYLTIDTYVNQSVIVFDANTDIIDSKFLFYNLSSRYEELRQLSDGTSTRGGLSGWIVRRMEIYLPPLAVQKQIVTILSAIDDKIELNTAINQNLEQQVQAIFIKMFGDKLGDDTSSVQLGDLVTIVDNRGKTPPLEKQITGHPIIDVKALSGNSRIINYNNCTKYVNANTYNTWFRNGHPQPFDILLSTVGSLAEMKIFLGNVGCIAQNVVGFRSKGISPFYLYQYLSFIKKDLVAYNIGSVQPSIKVTHIIKHRIYVPPEKDLLRFSMLAESITNEIYNNCIQNRNLSALRDTLLPKLMNGEIDVSAVKV